jgi:hypothetical protein
MHAEATTQHNCSSRSRSRSTMEFQQQQQSHSTAAMPQPRPGPPHGQAQHAAGIEQVVRQQLLHIQTGSCLACSYTQVMWQLATTWQGLQVHCMHTNLSRLVS